MIHDAEDTPNSPFAIGGLGGSGTRATAMLVRNCGCWLGGDLNDALDNLWFTLLFKRASVLTDADVRLETLFSLFQARMGGEVPELDTARELTAFAKHDRFGHSTEWFQARLQSLLTASVEQAGGMRWGWKEPNTHIIIERLFRYAPDLKYVHVVRDPFYMATSKNRNQLKNWGQAFLDRTPSGSIRDTIAFWVAAHRRLEELSEHHPGRIMFFNHDAFMANPAPEAARLLAFLNLDPPDNQQQLFEGIVFRSDRQPDSTGLATQTDPDDLSFCETFTSRLS